MSFLASKKPAGYFPKRITSVVRQPHVFPKPEIAHSVDSAEGYAEIGSTARAVFRLGLIGLLVLVTNLVYLALLAMPWVRRARWPRYFHRALARKILGVKIVVRGAPRQAAPGQAPTLFVGNHSSYLDISVLGSLIEEASFIAKSEMEGWPVINHLCAMQRTVFVVRRAGDASRQSSELRDRLEAGDSLILFPEGTTSDGNRVLPFKSSLFAPVMKPTEKFGPVMVQPVSIIATAIDGITLGRTFRPLYAWYGDMGLGWHVWPLLKQGRLTVEVEFHEPVDSTGFRDRKALADYCYRTVAEGVEQAVTGRSKALPDHARRRLTAASSDTPSHLAPSSPL